MKLKDYLDKNGITPSVFAGMIFVTDVTVYRYINEKSAPNSVIRKRINNITKGKVTSNDFDY